MSEPTHKVTLWFMSEHEARDYMASLSLPEPPHGWSLDAVAAPAEETGQAQDLAALSLLDLERMSIRVGCETDYNRLADMELRRRGYTFNASEARWCAPAEETGQACPKCGETRTEQIPVVGGGKDERCVGCGLTRGDALAASLCPHGDVRHCFHDGCPSCAVSPPAAEGARPEGSFGYCPICYHQLDMCSHCDTHLPTPSARLDEIAREHLERLETMSKDTGETWDLSDNDHAALRWATSFIRRATRGEEAQG